MMKTILLLGFMLISLAAACCDIIIQPAPGYSGCCHAGDTVKVIVRIRYKQDKCSENPEKTVIYKDGFRVCSESAWILNGTDATKELILVAKPGKKNNMMITAVRETRYDYCFKQLNFTLCL